MVETIKQQVHVLNPFEHVRSLCQRIAAKVGERVVGQEETVQCVTAGLLLGGHVLMEGVPGVGKTLLARTLADVVHLKFARVQFTPDLMPSDILGTYHVQVAPDGRPMMSLQKGPLFSNVVLADEINRASPKTQSALLESMEERQVSVDAQTYKLPRPFMVIATQNPVELEGTYPLPEAQLDRFFFKLHVSFPNRDELHSILDRTTTEYASGLHPVVTRDDIVAMQALSRSVPVAKHVQDYAVRLLLATHPGGADSPESVGRFVRTGASPRGAQAMLMAAKIRALIEGRFAASIDDVKIAALPALRHRVLLNFEGEAEGIKTDQVIKEILAKLPESKG